MEVTEVRVYPVDEEKLKDLFKDKDICINLVGILSESKKNTFKNIHTYFPALLSKKCENFLLLTYKIISTLYFFCNKYKYLVN